MRKTDQQLGRPFIDFTDTKTNVEAFTAVVGMHAVATDTGQFGYYDGTVWDWLDFSNAVLGAGTGVSGQVTYWLDTDTIGSDANFFRDSFNNRVGIGTNTPSTILEIFSSGVMNALGIADGGIAQFALRSHTNTSNWSGRIDLTRTRGTQASPLAVISGDALGVLSARGSYGAAVDQDPRGQFEFFSTETHTVSSQGVAWLMKTTANGGILTTEKMRMTGDGNLGIGTQSPQKRLHVELFSSITSSVGIPVRISHMNNASTAVNFGVGIDFELENDVGSEIAGLDSTSFNVIGASWEAYRQLKVGDFNSLREAIRLYADGTEALVGIGLGANPQSKLHVGGYFAIDEQSGAPATITDTASFWPESDNTFRMKDGDGLEHIIHGFPTFKSYTVTTQGLGGAATVYAGGNYLASSTDSNLTQSSLTQTFGSSNKSYAMHAFIVFGDSGVNTGVVGLRVTGTSINDQGTRTASDSETILADITTPSINDYIESSKKWLGTVTFELFTVSGSPTIFSLDFNYGLDKYEDWSNTDFDFTAFEVVGFAGANDSNTEIKMLLHDGSGWVYAATSFEPGGTVLASMNTDHNTEIQLANGEPFQWKRDNISQTVLGSSNEGVIMKFITTVPNTIEFANIHFGVEF